MAGRGKLVVYTSKKICLTSEEKAELESKLSKEALKRHRDEKCGGIDERGNYTRLHDRGSL